MFDAPSLLFCGLDASFATLEIMTKKKAPKTTRDRRRLKQEQHERQIWLASNVGIIKQVLKLIWAVPVILSVLISLNAFFPRITVSQGDSVREHESMATVFQVTNNGTLALNDVQIFCGIDHLGPNVGGFSIAKPESNVGMIDPGDTRTSPCEDLISGNQTDGGEMSIDVSYRPSYWFWRRGKRFQMKSTRTDRGTWIWRQISTSDYDSGFPPPP